MGNADSRDGPLSSASSAAVANNSSPSLSSSAANASGGTNGTESTREITPLDSAALKRRIQAGVQYNMRIVLKGERCSGKTSLFRRLQGLGFTSVYTPTPEIQTATINWTFRKDDDSSVKVEVWDVVDKGFVPPGSVDLISNGKRITSTPSTRGVVTQGKHRFGALDATVMDVYKNCQAVIICVNPFSQTSLDYIREEIDEIPKGISIVLALCYRDRLRISSSEPEIASIEQLPPLAPPPTADPTVAIIHQCKQTHHTLHQASSAGSAVITMSILTDLRQELLDGNDEEDGVRREIHLLEVSSLNCYGLKELHRYLSLPYLSLKIDAMKIAMDRLLGDRASCEKELRSSVQKAAYGEFAKQFELRRGQSGATAPVATSASTAVTAPTVPLAAPAVASETLRTDHRANPKAAATKSTRSSVNPTTLAITRDEAEWEGFLDDDDDDDNSQRRAPQRRSSPADSTRSDRVVASVTKDPEVGASVDASSVPLQASIVKPVERKSRKKLGGLPDVKEMGEGTASAGRPPGLMKVKKAKRGANNAAESVKEADIKEEDSSVVPAEPVVIAAPADPVAIEKTASVIAGSDNARAEAQDAAHGDPGDLPDGAHAQEASLGNCTAVDAPFASSAAVEVIDVHKVQPEVGSEAEPAKEARLDPEEVIECSVESRGEVENAIAAIETADVSIEGEVEDVARDGAWSPSPDEDTPLPSSPLSFPSEGSGQLSTTVIDTVSVEQVSAVEPVTAVEPVPVPVVEPVPVPAVEPVPVSAVEPVPVPAVEPVPVPVVEPVPVPVVEPVPVPVVEPVPVSAVSSTQPLRSGISSSVAPLPAVRRKKQLSRPQLPSADSDSDEPPHSHFSKLSASAPLGRSNSLQSINSNISVNSAVSTLAHIGSVSSMNGETSEQGNSAMSETDGEVDQTLAAGLDMGLGLDSGIAAAFFSDSDSDKDDSGPALGTSTAFSRTRVTQNTATGTTSTFPGPATQAASKTTSGLSEAAKAAIAIAMAGFSQPEHLTAPTASSKATKNADDSDGSLSEHEVDIDEIMASIRGGDINQGRPKSSSGRQQAVADVTVDTESPVKDRRKKKVTAKKDKAKPSTFGDDDSDDDEPRAPVLKKKEKKAKKTVDL